MAMITSPPTQAAPGSHICRAALPTCDISARACVLRYDRYDRHEKADDFLGDRVASRINGLISPSLSIGPL
jgi:hypothetical protein